MVHAMGARERLCVLIERLMRGERWQMDERELQRERRQSGCGDGRVKGRGGGALSGTCDMVHNTPFATRRRPQTMRMVGSTEVVATATCTEHSRESPEKVRMQSGGQRGLP